VGGIQVSSKESKPHPHQKTDGKHTRGKKKRKKRKETNKKFRNSKRVGIKESEGEKAEGKCQTEANRRSLITVSFRRNRNKKGCSKGKWKSQP